MDEQQCSSTGDVCSTSRGFVGSSGMRGWDPLAHSKAALLMGYGEKFQRKTKIHWHLWDNCRDAWTSPLCPCCWEAAQEWKDVKMAGTPFFVCFPAFLCPAAPSAPGCPMNGVVGTAHHLCNSQHSLWNTHFGSLEVTFSDISLKGL